MKMRCLLIDDEPPALKVLQSHLAQVGGFEIVGLCSNAVEAMDILHRRPVDVLFLDIKMPKIIGTEFLRNLSHPPKVIFVTAYREYAVEGFELDAVDYMVKPVSFERFLKAVDRLKRVIGEHPPVETNHYSTKPEAFVYLKAEKAMQKIFVNDITYIEGYKDYVKLYFDNGKYLLVKQSIKAIENLLSEHNFMRVHRSYIVSIPRISGYTNMEIQLSSKDIPIGRLYKRSVISQLSAF
jgi:DNA-binding LytR/AlgR family response regulator